MGGMISLNAIRECQFMPQDRIASYTPVQCVLGESLFLLVATTILYLVAPSLSFSFPPFLLSLHAIMGFLVADSLFPPHDMPTKRVEIMTFCATGGILLLLFAYEALANGTGRPHSLISACAFILLVAAPFLVLICSAITGMTFAKLRRSTSDNRNVDGRQKSKSTGSFWLVAGSTLIFAIVLNALQAPMQEAFAPLFPITAEAGAITAVVEPLSFGNTGISVDINALFSLSKTQDAHAFTQHGSWGISLLIATLSSAALIQIASGCLRSTQISPSAVDADAAQAQLETAFAARGFSARESSVLTMRAYGYTYDRIASTLGISPSTARTYCSRALGKIEAETASDAAAKALPSWDTNFDNVKSETAGNQPGSAKSKRRLSSSHPLFPFACGVFVGEATAFAELQSNTVVAIASILATATALIAIARKGAQGIDIQGTMFAMSSILAGIGTALGTYDAVNRLNSFLAAVGSTNSGFVISNVILIALPIISLILATFSFQTPQLVTEIQTPASQDTARTRLLQHGLTPLYAEIMLQVFEGQDTKGICKLLHVARGTVKDARSKCYASMHVHSEREFRNKLGASIHAEE